MDQKLQKLIRQLRSEKCPPRVLGKVKARIAASEKAPSHFYRTLGMVMSSAAAVAIMALFLIRPGETPSIPSSKPIPVASLSNQQVAQEAHLALALIGNALLEAGQKTGERLFNEAVPPLRSGFETTKQKLTRSSE